MLDSEPSLETGLKPSLKSQAYELCRASGRRAATAIAGTLPLPITAKDRARYPTAASRHVTPRRVTSRHGTAVGVTGASRVAGTGSIWALGRLSQGGSRAGGAGDGRSQAPGVGVALRLPPPPSGKGGGRGGKGLGVLAKQTRQGVAEDLGGPGATSCRVESWPRGAGKGGARGAASVRAAQHGRKPTEGEG